MKNFILVVTICLISCSSQQPNINGHLNDISNVDLQLKYKTCLANIGSSAKKAPLEKIPALLELSLVDSIFDYWYGTEWDFNGTTQEPQNGKIACGYFVTTTLKHLGLNINRVYLAQQASSVLIKEICDETSIKIFTNGKFEKMKTYVNKYNGNIFIAGLDNHVGFIVREENELFFIHASGIAPYKVVKDKIDESPLIKNSQYFMVGHLNFANWAKGIK